MGGGLKLTHLEFRSDAATPRSIPLLSRTSRTLRRRRLHLSCWSGDGGGANGGNAVGTTLTTGVVSYLTLSLLDSRSVRVPEVNCFRRFCFLIVIANLCAVS